MIKGISLVIPAIGMLVEWIFDGMPNRTFIEKGMTTIIICLQYFIMKDILVDVVE